MDLDRFTCNHCGELHELCRCLDMQEDYFYQIQNEDIGRLSEKYPKFLDNKQVEISEGIIIDRLQFDKM